MKKGFILLSMLSLCTLSCQAAKTLCQGDSITYGQGVSSNKGYPERLQELRNQRFIDRGIRGITAGKSVYQTQVNIDETNPDRVTLMLGTNNINIGSSKSDILGSMQTIINIIRSNGVEPVLCTIPPYVGPVKSYNDDVESYNNGLRELGALNNIRVPRIFAAFNNSSSFMQSDGFHPNTAGQDLMASVIHAKLGPPTVCPPRLLFPIGEILDRTPKFRWTPVEGAERYRFSLFQEGNLINRFTTVDTSWVAPLEMDCADYTWNVRSFADGRYGISSRTRSYSFDMPSCCVPPRSEVLKPLNGQYLRSDRFVQKWSAVDCADKYELWLNRNGQAYSRITFDSTLREVTHRLVESGHPFGKYTLRVKSISTDGASFSRLKTFEYGTPRNPVIDGRLISWNDLSSQDAEYYHVRIHRDGKIWYDNRRVERSKTSEITGGPLKRQWRLPQDIPEGDYRLMIRAKKADGFVGSWSNPHFFSR